MYDQDKQTNRNTKLHTHSAQGARITPLHVKSLQQKNVETNLSNAILNSNSINYNDVNSNTSNNNKIIINNSNNNNNNDKTIKYKI